jgi:hypothetical protein
MSRPFWQHERTLTDGQTARTDPINRHLDAIEGGFGNVAEELNRSVRFTANETFSEGTLQLPQTAAQRANTVMGFDATGTSLQLRSGTFNWRGNWAGATFYNLNDVAIGPAANFNSIYVCTSQHTSGVFATDLAAGRWQLIIDLTQVYRFVRRFRILTAADSPFTATAGDDLMVDVSSGAVQITLPSAPALEDQPIHVVHIGGNIVSNAITVARNGKLLMGLAENMTVNTANASFELAFSNNTYGWRLVKGT